MSDARLRKGLERLVKNLYDEANKDDAKALDDNQRLSRGETIMFTTGPFTHLKRACADRIAAALAGSEGGHKDRIRIPCSFPVTDDGLDAPDGAEVTVRFRRVGESWERIDEVIARPAAPVASKGEEVLVRGKVLQNCGYGRVRIRFTGGCEADVNISDIEYAAPKDSRRKQ